MIELVRTHAHSWTKLAAEGMMYLGTTAMRGCGGLTCEDLGHLFVLHAVIVQVSGTSGQSSDLIGVERARLVLAEG